MKSSVLGLSVLLVAAALTAACGGGPGGNSGGGGTGGTTSTGGTTTGGTSTGGTQTGGTNTGASTTGGTSTGGTSTGGTNTGGSTTTSGTICGGIAGLQCAPTEYCDYPEDICGADDGTGTCKPRPDVCPDNIDPVCACDGAVYNNSCEAAAAGQDIQTLGGCKAPMGQFQCGAGFCALGQQYCEVQISDVAGFPNTYGCKPLPEPCTNPNATCACLVNVPCGGMCSQADGGFTVTCPGG